MIKIALFLLVLTIMGCGKDDDQPQCAATKDLASEWAFVDSDSTFDYRACGVGVVCNLTIDGTCDDDPGEAKALFSSNGNLAIANCDNTAILDNGKWAIGCDNILRITEYESGDPDEILE